MSEEDRVNPEDEGDGSGTTGLATPLTDSELAILERLDRISVRLDDVSKKVQDLLDMGSLLNRNKPATSYEPSSEDAPESDEDEQEAIRKPISYKDDVLNDFLRTSP